MRPALLLSAIFATCFPLIAPAAETAAEPRETVVLAEGGFLPLVKDRFDSFALAHPGIRCKLTTFRTPGEVPALEISTREAPPDSVTRLFAVRGTVLLVSTMNTVPSISAADARAVMDNRFPVWSKLGVRIRHVYFVSGTEPRFDLRKPENGPVCVITSTPDEAAKRLREDVSAIAVLPAASVRFDFPETRPMKIDGVDFTPQNVAAGRYALAKRYFLSVRKDAPAPVREMFDSFASPNFRGRILEFGAIPLKNP